MTDLNDLINPNNRRVDLWTPDGDLVVKDLVLIPDTKTIPNGIKWGGRVFFLNSNSGKYIEGYLYTDQNNFRPGYTPPDCVVKPE